MRARPGGPNPSGPAYDTITLMKKKIFVEKQKFDAALGALLKAKPIPRKGITTQGKRGPKTPIFQKS